MTRLKQISKRFSEAAEYYHNHAEIQRQIADDTVELLDKGLEGRVLDLGCGTGFVASRIARENPKAKILGIDIAPGMIEIAKMRFADLGNLSFIVGDCTSCLIQSEVSAVISSSSLQWMYPFDETLSHWVRMLSPHGRVVISFMIPGTLAELKAARERVTGARTTENLPTLEDIVIVFNRLGMKVQRKFTKSYTASYSSAEELLGDLRALGVNAPLRDEPELKMTPEELSALRQDLDKVGVAMGSLTLSYQVGFISTEARKLGHC
jgi:malonyl-CoA O-methyltransferase